MPRVNSQLEAKTAGVDLAVRRQADDPSGIPVNICIYLVYNVVLCDIVYIYMYILCIFYNIDEVWHLEVLVSSYRAGWAGHLIAEDRLLAEGHLRMRFCRGKDHA